MLIGLIVAVSGIVGTWVDGFMYSPIDAIIYLVVGAGAIFQVVFSIASMMTKDNNKYNGQINNENNKKQQSFLITPVIAGFVIGMVIMYVTSLMIPS